MQRSRCGGGNAAQLSLLWRCPSRAEVGSLDNCAHKGELPPPLFREDTVTVVGGGCWLLAEDLSSLSKTSSANAMLGAPSL